MKKICNKYYLSVEGETEKWYFEHLQNLINKNEDLPCKVKFNIKIENSITSRAKTITSPYGGKIFHICDYESNEDCHTEKFNKVLAELNNVKKIKRNLVFKLGYSNYSFDLWMILHKKQQIGPVSHRRQYINGINKAYNENFQFIDEYKNEDNFKKILSNIELKDVKFAIKNANEIRKLNEQHSIKTCRTYGDFKYFTDNPDLTINECVEQILKECGAIKR